ncbi:metallophosphoesterase family protein [Bacillus thuringiensis]|uniref:Serine/threonine protein phosphatase n=1 Tax=Bacillus thuringiensis TaxID=1428 RepID=A0A9X6ZQP5_BACTU|nr:metallophosphoesterase family protein [Bacillus thuringiensis]PFJ31831.1 serine/threonine protein phosphatase [Bacillus thuringiensis]
MRKFFMSDIHGHYTPMMKLLEYVKFNPNEDTIIFGGDMIDRGPDSGKVVKEIKVLQEMYPSNVKAIVGNHEEMLIWYLLGRSSMWLKYGGIEAAKSFNEVFGIKSQEKDEHIEWIMNLPITEQDEDGVYCHAGLDIAYGLEEQPRDVLWMNADELFSYTVDEILDYTNDRKMYRGHNPVHHVKTDMARVCCDLGIGVLEPTYAGLALVDITNQTYYRYSAKSHTISHKKIELL